MDTSSSRSSSRTRSSLRDSSITRSRSRREQFQKDEVTPLLTNLSPAAILDALTSTGAVPQSSDQRHHFIKASVEDTSESERAFGVKAAIAGKKIREWLHELSSWPWDNEQGRSFDHQWALHQLDDYSLRIDIIKDGMATLRVGELQDHVRKSHIKAELDTTGYEKLEDFTAIVLATIVQSLPPLMHLEGLLKAWSTRLLILRRKDDFRVATHVCQETMVSAWTAIGVHKQTKSVPRKNFTRQNYHDIQPILQDQLTMLGRKIDEMLDILETSHDTLPEHWIDTVDTLESEYTSWTVKAQELALNNDLQESERQATPGAQNANIAVNQATDTDLVDKELKSEPDPPPADQMDGAAESILCQPFVPKALAAASMNNASNTSDSSDEDSTRSRPGSSTSSRSSRRSSVEIMSASIATNPGSPRKVSTPIRNDFDTQIKRYSSVKSKDILRLVLPRRDSCPSAIPPSKEVVRRNSFGGTSLASQPGNAEPTGGMGPPSNESLKEPHSEQGSESISSPRTPSPTKLKHRFEQYEDLDAEPETIKIQKQRPNNLPQAANAAAGTAFNTPTKPKDKFEASITSLLNRIPADIRLKSAGARTPPPRPLPPLQQPKAPMRRSITPKLLRPKTPTTPGASPSLTLAPASEPGPKALNRSIHDPEIKLYHLHQSHLNGTSKEATPIKLYVRLVGSEGERVMVRVGGGWADLGDYLREYAAHHGANSARGQRSVSDFQVQNLPTPTSTSGMSTPVSGVAGAAANGAGGSTNGSGKRFTRSANNSRPSSRSGGRPGSSMSWFHHHRHNHDGANDDPPSPSPAGGWGSINGNTWKPSPEGEVDGKATPGAGGSAVTVDEIVKQANGMGKRAGGGIKRVFLRRRSTLGEGA